MGLYDDILQAAAVKNPAVSVVMFLIRNIEARRVNVKRIRVLHGELPGAQQAGFGPGFIAKFRLDLIPNLGQLLVAAQFLARDLRHDLLFGHAQAKVAAAAILEAKHVFTHCRPAATGFPDFTGMQYRQVEFLADFVHFIANNVADFQDRTLAKKKVGVNTCAKLTDVARPHEELMAGHFGISRGLAQCGNE